MVKKILILIPLVIFITSCTNKIGFGYSYNVSMENSIDFETKTEEVKK